MKTITINRPRYRDQEVGDEFQINYQRYRVTRQYRGKHGASKGCLQACLATEGVTSDTGEPVLVVYDEIIYKHSISKLEEL